MDFPDLFLRGIVEKDHVDEENNVSSAVFYFTEKKDIPLRIDDFNEESIFWKDDDGAVDLLLAQKKEGKPQFKVGAAIVDRNSIDRVRDLPITKGHLKYERFAIPGNHYHGNLLLKKSVKRKLMQKIAAAIALCCVGVVKQK